MNGMHMNVDRLPDGFVLKPSLTYPFPFLCPHQTHNKQSTLIHSFHSRNNPLPPPPPTISCSALGHVIM
ncbi:hypothetical protein GBA52_027887 [Prunus armeniaca]|nr:hypothetical protein GBA52_027887 [Prunus armeniaca]